MRSAAADTATIQQLRSRSFLISWLTRIAIALAIVFLMTNKPDLVWALLSVVIATAVGMATGAVATRRVALHQQVGTR